jgi:hypothetical protein
MIPQTPYMLFASADVEGIKPEKNIWRGSTGRAEIRFPFPAEIPG